MSPREWFKNLQIRLKNGVCDEFWTVSCNNYDLNACFAINIFAQYNNWRQDTHHNNTMHNAIHGNDLSRKSLYVALSRRAISKATLCIKCHYAEGPYSCFCALYISYSFVKCLKLSVVNSMKSREY